MSTSENRRPPVLGNPNWQRAQEAEPSVNEIDSVSGGAGLTLHPNLARIAASYQQICARHARGELDVAAANAEIRELVARDDDGVCWMINPRDGGWMYKARNGASVAATPPSYGLATLTPFDVSGSPVAHGGVAAYNPDSELRFRAIDERIELDSRGLRGITRRQVAADRPLRRPRWLYPLLAAVVAVLAAFAVATALDDGTELTPPPTGTPLPQNP